MVRVIVAEGVFCEIPFENAHILDRFFKANDFEGLRAREAEGE